MKWRWVLLLSVIGFMSAGSFAVVLNEPWLHDDHITYEDVERFETHVFDRLGELSEPRDLGQCRYTAQGSRPGEHDREHWVRFKCVDETEFELVLTESMLTNIIWNLPEAES